MGNKLNFIPSTISDLYTIELKSFKDERGEFSRLFCKEELHQIGFDKEIVNVNFSSTKTKGTIRGMHRQVVPHAEVKIVKCIKGAIYDVAVDMRKNSPTYLQWYAEKLTATNNKMLYIPEGFAHGFQTLEENSEIVYFNTAYYEATAEEGVLFNDPLVSIDWPLAVTVVSDKDKNFSLLEKDI